MFAAVLVLLAQTTTPSPSPCGCQANARIVSAMYPVDFSPPGESGPIYATVAVTVGPNGNVEKAVIATTSNNLSFDAASIRAARLSKYKPKIIDCHPVESVVDFKTLAVQGTYTPPPVASPSPTPYCVNNENRATHKWLWARRL